MPIVATALANGNGSSTANASPYTTGSITPVANQLTLAFVITTVSSGGPPPTPTLTGNNLTWTLHGTITFNNSISQLCRLSVFRSLGPSPTTGTASIAVTGSPTGAIWSFIGVAGSDTTGAQGANAIVQVPTGSSDGTTGNAVTPFLTLATFANGGNGALAAFGLGVQQAITPPTGWTELGDILLATPATSLEVSWINTADTTPDATWGATSRTAGGLALEIRLPVTFAQIGPVTESVGLSDTPTVRLPIYWDGKINLLAQPHILDTLTLSDVPTVVESTVTGPRTFSTSDQVTLTESVTITGLTLAGLFTDAVPLTDSVTVRGLTVASLLADTLTLTESLSLPGLTPVIQSADSLTLTDTPNGQLPSAGILFIPLAADTLTLPESVTLQGLPLERLVSEAVPLTDTPTFRGLTQALQTADSLTLSDPPTVIEITPGIRAFSTSDTVGLVESAEAELFGAIGDTITITESVQVAVGLQWDGTINLLAQPHILDPVTMSDVPTIAPFTLPTWLVTAADTLTLVETRSLTGLTLARLVADQVTLAENTPLTGLTVVAMTTDSLPVLETITPTGLLLLSTTADTLTLSDPPTVIRAIQGVWQINLGDTLTLTESITLPGLTLISSAVEVVPLTDVPNVLLGAVAPRTFTAADTLTITESSPVTGLIPGASGLETLPITESVSLTGLRLLANTSDTLTLVDTPNFSLAISRVDSLTLSDTPVVRGLVLRLSVTDSLTLTESLNVFAGRRASDLIGVSDVPTVFTIGGIFSQPLLVFAVPARNLAATAIVGLTVFDVPARNLTVEAVQTPLVYPVEARDLTVEAIVGVTQFVVSARDLSVEAQSAA